MTRWEAETLLHQLGPVAGDDRSRRDTSLRPEHYVRFANGHETDPKGQNQDRRQPY